MDQRHGTGQQLIQAGISGQTKRRAEILWVERKSVALERFPHLPKQSTVTNVAAARAAEILARLVLPTSRMTDRRDRTVTVQQERSESSARKLGRANVQYFHLGIRFNRRIYRQSLGTGNRVIVPESGRF